MSRREWKRVEAVERLSLDLDERTGRFTQQRYRKGLGLLHCRRVVAAAAADGYGMNNVPWWLRPSIPLRLFAPIGP